MWSKIRQWHLETKILGVICLLDMASTMWLVSKGLAVEANPILAWAFAYGIWGFAIVKLSFLPILFAIEKCRQKSPAFTKYATITGIGAYLLIYIGGSIHLLFFPPIG